MCLNWSSLQRGTWKSRGMKKDSQWNPFCSARKPESMSLFGLRLFALHHHLALVVELALVPVGAVEHVRLARRWAGAHVGRRQGVVGAALARARLALPSLGMCHSALVVESF